MRRPGGDLARQRRRYLEHYLSTGEFELRLQYGVGRPERHYHLRGV
jgi:response regulator of citrate/malate metabolism